MTVMNYQEVESYINSIPKFSKTKSRENTRSILEVFGNPQEGFKYIHVAGTNGKGSVCAYIDSILRTAGKRTGLFTSPHLVTTTERMKADGTDISQDDFVRIFEILMTVVNDRMSEGFPHPTYFEFLYLMAMIWFGEQEIEYGVIETGLGGRLDATNLVTRPQLVVITSISYDHTELLGDTLTAIAGEKAGIIKAGVPVICDGSQPEVLAVIRRRAAELLSPVEVLMPENIKKIVNVGENIDFSLEFMYDEVYRIRLHTPAVYQTVNSSLALMAARFLLKDSQDWEKAACQGIFKMHWPARLEEVMPDIYVDGAHNVGGIQALTASLRTGFSDRSLWLLFAVASDKNYADMIGMLTGLPNLCGVIVTELENNRKTDIRTVADLFEKNWHGYVSCSYNINEAIIEGERLKGTDGMLLCTGSLYLAGSVLEVLGGQTDD